MTVKWRSGWTWIHSRAGNMDKIKYDIFDQIPSYGYCDDIVGLTIGAFKKYLHNEIFHK